MQARIHLGSALGAVLMLASACSSESTNSGGKGGSTTGGGGTPTGGTPAGGSSGSGGSGGASGGGTAGGAADAGTGRPPDLPNSDSQADIGAFVESGGYKRASWISETDEPRAGTVGTQHAGKVRVWENPPLVASLKGGRDGRMGRPFPDQWSMAVKELYDETTGELVGAAAAFKTLDGGEFGAWTYYCYGPDNRCSSNGPAPKDMPVYGKGSTFPGNQCGFCHGFSIYTIPP